MRSGMRLTSLAAVAAMAIVGGSTAGAADADWPGLRGPEFDGSVRNVRFLEQGATAADLTVGWMTDLGPGYSSVVVGDRRVVTMFASGDADWAAAYDVVTGAEVWKYRVGDTYAGHDGSHDGPISTPLLDGGRVYGLGAHGQLFALDAATGEELWAIHAADDLGGVPPFYGFGTSPILADGTLVVEIGAGEGKAIAGLDPDTGALRWSLGDGEINYQSPIVVTIDGTAHVVAGDAKVMYGIDASTGTVLWSHEHQGDERAMGGATIIPVPSGEGRLLIMNKIDSSAMLQVTRDGDGWSVTELWANNAIKQSYVVPVFHDGYLYGMNNRILVCVDAATGEIAWRSREPGDGFPTVVGDLLVIATKPGTLHVADASPTGYHELARIELFGEHTWSTVAYADGSLFARSMAKLARIDGVSGGTSGTSDGTPARVASDAFGRFLAGLETATDKSAAIDEFLAEQVSFPIVEDSGAVHFVYRGEADDVGIVGDMIGSRREDPMTHIPGTDLFVYSTMLEPTAAATYGFIPAFGEEAVADPLNPNLGDGLFGEVSFFALPAWERPAFSGEADPDRRGTLETFEWESAVKEGAKRTAQVYLPAGFDPSSDRRYPVLYVNGGKDALEKGGMKEMLDHLIGERITPVIAVFVIADEDNPRADLGNVEAYAKMIAEELVPGIDAKFPTIDDRMARAAVGVSSAGAAAMMTAFTYPALFGRIGTQSVLAGADDARELMPSAADTPMVIYHEWGTYHLRSPHEAWDLAVDNRELWALMRERGYRPAGGEVPEGFGWAVWKARTDDLLVALFPLRRASN